MTSKPFTPTRERVQSLLSYDPLTGIFLWKVDRKGKAKAGTVAGRPNTNGHRQISIDNVRYMAHNLAWLLETGDWPKDQIDHENRNPDDNRFKNLREATGSENCANQIARSTNTSGFKGVSLHKKSGKYTAYFAGQYLGLFASPIEAAKTYDDHAKSRRGKFARVNF